MNSSFERLELKAEILLNSSTNARNDLLNTVENFNASVDTAVEKLDRKVNSVIGKFLFDLLNVGDAITVATAVLVGALNSAGYTHIAANISNLSSQALNVTKAFGARLQNVTGFFGHLGNLSKEEVTERIRGLN